MKWTVKKKKWIGIIGISALAALTSLSAAGLWVNANLDHIVRNLTGKPVRLSGVDIDMVPAPAIVLTNLALQERENTIEVPCLRLYPDLGEMVRGRMGLKKAVLEDPLIKAVGSWGAQGETRRSGDPIAMDGIPDTTVVINRARLLLTADRGAPLRASVTARAQKTGRGLAVDLTEASIDEIGLEFTGEVKILSLAPLKISVHAKEGAFRPDALKKALLRFGYITQENALHIPSVRHMGARGLEVRLDAAGGPFHIAAKTLILDAVELRDVDVTVFQDGRLSASCSAGLVDAPTIYGWARQSQGGREFLKKLLVRAHLKTIAPQGAFHVTALKLQAGPGPNGAGQRLNRLEGVLDIESRDLSVLMVHENKQEQRVTVRRLLSKVTFEKGRPAIQVYEFSLDSSLGGTGRISGQIRIPASLEAFDVSAAVDGFKMGQATVDLHIDKPMNVRSADFDVRYEAAGIGFSADGAFLWPARQNQEATLRLGRVLVANKGPTTETDPTSLDQPLDAGAVAGRDLNVRITVDTLQYSGLPRLRDVDLHFRCAADRADIHGTMRMGEAKATVEAVCIAPDQLAANIETRGTDMDLTAFIGCFSTELPVYLDGRLYVGGHFAVHGKTPRQLIDGAQGEMTMVLHQGTVRRVSNLDPRLAYDLYKIDGRIRMVDKAGTELGRWKDSAFKRKIAIPTSPISVATTIAGAFLDASTRKQMRLVVYDWGWKVTQFVPESPGGRTLPQVVAVASNIDKGTFAVGEQVGVRTIEKRKAH